MYHYSRTVLRPYRNYIYSILSCNNIYSHFFSSHLFKTQFHAPFHSTSFLQFSDDTPIHDLETQSSIQPHTTTDSIQTTSHIQHTIHSIVSSNHSDTTTADALNEDDYDSFTLADDDIPEYDIEDDSSFVNDLYSEPVAKLVNLSSEQQKQLDQLQSSSQQTDTNEQMSNDSNQIESQAIITNNSSVDESQTNSIITSTSTLSSSSSSNQSRVTSVVKSMTHSLLPIRWEFHEYVHHNNVLGAFEYIKQQGLIIAKKQQQQQRALLEQQPKTETTKSNVYNASSPPPRRKKKSRNGDNGIATVDPYTLVDISYYHDLLHGFSIYGHIESCHVILARMFQIGIVYVYADFLHLMNACRLKHDLAAAIDTLQRTRRAEFRIQLDSKEQQDTMLQRNDQVVYYT